MSTHTIYEHGNGFPDVGERVYSSEDNSVYTVASIDSHIMTRQYQANRVLATLEYNCDATDLDDGEFNSLRDLRIKTGEDGE